MWWPGGHLQPYRPVRAGMEGNEDDHTSGGRRRRTAKRVGMGAALAVVGALLSPAGAAQAALADVGPVSVENG